MGEPSMKQTTLYDLKKVVWTSRNCAIAQAQTTTQGKDAKAKGKGGKGGKAKGKGTNSNDGASTGSGGGTPMKLYPTIPTHGIRELNDDPINDL